MSCSYTGPTIKQRLNITLKEAQHCIWSSLLEAAANSTQLCHSQSTPNRLLQPLCLVRLNSTCSCISQHRIPSEKTDTRHGTKAKNSLGRTLPAVTCSCVAPFAFSFVLTDGMRQDTWWHDLAAFLFCPYGSRSVIRRPRMILFE